MLTQLELECLQAMSVLVDRLQAKRGIVRVQPTSGQLAPAEPVPFDPPYVPVEPSGFMVPTGTYRGRRLNELDNDTLRNLFNGYRGCGKLDIADTILAEIHLRQGNL